MIVSALCGTVADHSHLLGTKAMSVLAAPVPLLIHVVCSCHLNDGNSLSCLVVEDGQRYRKLPAMLWPSPDEGVLLRRLKRREHQDLVMPEFLDLGHFAITAAVQLWVSDLTTLSFNPSTTNVFSIVTSSWCICVNEITCVKDALES